MGRERWLKAHRFAHSHTATSLMKTLHGEAAASPAGVTGWTPREKPVAAQRGPSLATGAGQNQDWTLHGRDGREINGYKPGRF